MLLEHDSDFFERAVFRFHIVQIIVVYIADYAMLINYYYHYERVT